MDNEFEQTSQVAVKKNRFSLSIFGNGGHKSSVSHDLNLHHNVDTGSLMHRSHAFSYNPRNPQPPARAQSMQASTDGVQDKKDEAIRMTLSTSGEPLSRWNNSRRRSSLFGSTSGDQKKQLPVLKIQESESGYIALTNDYGVRVSERRSPRRYSAAQSSLEKINQDTAALLQKMCTAKISSHEEEAQSFLESSSPEPWRSSTQSPSGMWDDYSAHQNPVSSTSLATIDSPLQTYCNQIPLEKPTSVPASDDNQGYGYQGYLTDISRQFIQPSPSSTVNGPQNKSLSQPLDFVMTPDNKIGSNVPTGKTLYIHERSNDKVRSAKNRQLTSNFSSGLSNYDKVNQTVSLQNAKHDLRENIIIENSLVLHQQTALNPSTSNNKTNPSSNQLTPKLPDYASSYSGVRNGTSNIDTGQYETCEGKDHKQSGLFSWAWSIGDWLGTKSEGQKVEVSKKDLNLIAPSSF